MIAIRRRGTASAAVLTGLALGLAFAHLTAPDWSRRVGLDVWNYDTAERDLRAAAAEQDEVEAFAERSARRREAAGQIAAQLAAGTIALPAAADELRDMFAGETAVTGAIDGWYARVPPGRLRYARHAIDRALRLVEDDPTRTEEVRARLEAEFCVLTAAPESPAVP